MKINLFFDNVKDYLEIDESIDIFDSRIESSIRSGLSTLKIMGIDDPKLNKNSDTYGMILDYLGAYSKLRVENIVDSNIKNVLNEIMELNLETLRAYYDN